MKVSSSENHEIENSLETSIQFFFKKFHVGSLLHRAHFKKTKGDSCLGIFQFLLTLIFKQKTFSQTLKSEKDPAPFKKDVVYRFLNSFYYNWGKFLSLLSAKLIITFLHPLTCKDRVNVLIADDSLLSRNRSKKVELLSRVHDHVTNTFKKGFVTSC